MSNIQESINSVLTTGGALKALGEKKELRKVEEEKRKVEGQKRKNAEIYRNKIKESQEYINALVSQKLKGKMNPNDGIKETTRNIVDYNFNPEFIDAEISAAEILKDTYSSEVSFQNFKSYRKSKGGNK